MRTPSSDGTDDDDDDVDFERDDSSDGDLEIGVTIDIVVDGAPTMMMVDDEAEATRIRPLDCDIVDDRAMTDAGV